MPLESTDYLLLAPEIFVLAMACGILVLDLFLTDRNRVLTYWLTQATLLGAFLITLNGGAGESQHAFGGTFISDPMADGLKLFIYLVTAAAFAYARPYLIARGLFKGEYYVLGLFGMLGMMVMVSASHFLTLYLGLELLSLSLYAMVAFNRDSYPCSEAAMKYFVLGALASGMLLYGISMVYGVTGTLDLQEVGLRLQAMEEPSLTLIFALCFLVVGLAFKLGAVPFHMWIPDVYHGAPTPVTLYVGSAPKIAAFAMVMRVLAESLQGLHGDWQGMLVILAVLSIGIGNLIAIAQTNIKRMLAYSTISHVGFLVLGVLPGTAEGYGAAMFYAITYAIMSAGAFGIVILLSREGFEADELEDYKGLNARNPWYAFLMLVLMFSMAGVPPTVGFYAKLAVLQAVLRIDLVWLAIVAVSFSVIGAFYYIRVVKLMYFDEPLTQEPLQGTADMRMVLSLNGLAVLGLGLFPGGLMALCASAFG